MNKEADITAKQAAMIFSLLAMRKSSRHLNGSLRCIQEGWGVITSSQLGSHSLSEIKGFPLRVSLEVINRPHA
jgi:hypothetical protein